MSIAWITGISVTAALAGAAPSSETSREGNATAPVEEPPSKDETEDETTSFLSGGLFERWNKKGNRTDPLDLPPQSRRFVLGVSGVIVSAPPIDPDVVSLDPRQTGRTATLAGGGLWGRYRPVSMLGVELGVHTGSVRYRSNSNTSDLLISHTQVLIDGAALLYLGRGAVAQFALSGGIGGLISTVGYEQGNLDGSQTWGSAVFRIGGEVEFLLKRVAFTLSLRNYAVLTKRDHVRNRGEFVMRSATRLAPVATFQSMVFASIGVAYRF